MILGTICCRGGSKGVLGKNIRPLKGIPLIVYTIDTAKKSKYISDLVVSSDSDEILNVAKENGIGKTLVRPKELATDTASKWPVFINAVEEYEKLSGKKVTYIVDMDVTVPLKTTEDIDKAIELALQSPEIDVVITGYEPERNPYFNMMEIQETGFAEMVKKTAKPIVRRQDAPKVFSLTPAAYVIKKEALYNYQHWSEAKCMISEMPRERAVDIDTELDFKLIEFLLNEK
ncbi:N-acylneuraminate cytidylyltransferase/CMP-N,N'-diacetyllegionaminic acid synthase [Flavobacterium nitrogenifigens]|uniref:N-acylneuraminate cytidylyltransferase/CMP-N,N'-diacetyllegionaminic acid synthase n=2 Tax=Flavobacterium TaxID=237 RepID=A0A7W7IZW1_9FLAO|nr:MULTISPECIES: acylneuraminate cytidylyltransferase family protein [Flavobacterium]MBB4803649.1 N-acylneuraminate cytidylyltransferase/CMP-N,N'-diacetyllegionaminic acid synthase [Flavobacterium nitrogenifigens]MBB6388546.1 N-acylneuraminate cytidylyltransferase/CMP-N,N'-diacetyllegionaminic acid synthase [Flavobacterium notoginsengisoli]